VIDTHLHHLDVKRFRYPWLETSWISRLAEEATASGLLGPLARGRRPTSPALTSLT
jgi:hypothetical protein